MREELKPHNRGFPNSINIIAFDCETEDGNAYLLTLYNGKDITYKWIDYEDKLSFDVNKVVSVRRGKTKGKIVSTTKEKIVTSKIIEVFINYLKDNIVKKGVNVLFAHNLEFDIGAVLDEIMFKLLEDSPHVPPKFEYTTELGDTFGIKLHGRNRWWGTMWMGNRNRKKKTVVMLLDTSSFVQGSLYNITRELELNHKKPSRPEHIGEGKKPKTRNEQTITYNYCRKEILAQYDLAKWIIDLHKEYDVPISVSMAHLGSKILRKQFTPHPIQQVPQNNEKIYVYRNDKGLIVSSQNPELLNHTHVMTTKKMYNGDTNKFEERKVEKYFLQKGIMRLSEHSTHGGRSSSFVGNNVIIKNVNVYDYNSFYPWAMTQLPRMSKGKWEKVNKFIDKFEGFYEVTGTVKHCRYPIIIPFPATMKFAGETKDERILKAPITSYELREALRTNEIEIDNLRGYIFIPDKDAVNPFKNFVLHFWDKRHESRDNTTKNVGYKLLMNSLYGKTYQTVPFPEYINQVDMVWDDERKIAVTKEKRYRAGSLYLPHVASWILGMTKAKLHQDLHKYKCLTCSTDSIMSRNRIKSSDRLGELKLVHVNDTPLENCLVLFLRPKLYVIFPSTIQKEVEKIEKEMGTDPHTALRKHLNIVLKQNSKKLALKYAKHGFRGTIRQLLWLYALKANEYDYDHFVRLREGIKQDITEKIRTVQKLTAHIKIDHNNPIMFCGYSSKKAVKQMELCIFPDCYNCAYTREL